MTPDLLDRLRERLGEASLRSYPPELLEGARVVATLTPEDAGALAAALRLCHEARVGVLVRGSGSRLETANAPCTAELVLDTQRLASEPEIDADDGVAKFAAGTPLADARKRLAESGWELPLDPPGDGTIGGVLASAACGPCFGHPRDVVLGMDMALANGDRIKFGGRVVKNVTGYDLNKLMVGAHGSLGVIEAAWLRLRPVPESIHVLSIPLDDHPDAARIALEAARRETARAVALMWQGESKILAVELAGDETAVAAEARALAEAGAQPADPGLVDAVRGFQGQGPIRVRVASLATRGDEAAATLASMGARVLVYPGRGEVYGIFAPEDPDDAQAVGEIWQAARLASERSGGPFAIERAPLAVRTGREVFGDVGDALPLHRALRAAYDPHGILNPGRFVGGL